MSTELQNAPNETKSVARPLATGLALLAGGLRLEPHPWNFSPVGALGLFGGGRLRSWQAFVLPLAVMIVSDVGLWAFRTYQGYPAVGWYTLFGYSSFLLYVLIGWWLCRTESVWR